SGIMSKPLGNIRYRQFFTTGPLSVYLELSQQGITILNTSLESPCTPTCTSFSWRVPLRVKDLQSLVPLDLSLKTLYLQPEKLTLSSPMPSKAAQRPKRSSRGWRASEHGSGKRTASTRSNSTSSRRS